MGGIRSGSDLGACGGAIVELAAVRSAWWAGGARWGPDGIHLAYEVSGSPGAPPMMLLHALATPGMRKRSAYGQRSFRNGHYLAGMDEFRARRVTDALRDRGVNAHLLRGGAGQFGVRVSLPGGREAE